MSTCFGWSLSRPKTAPLPNDDDDDNGVEGEKTPLREGDRQQMQVRGECTHIGRESVVGCEHPKRFLSGITFPFALLSFGLLDCCGLRWWHHIPDTHLILGAIPFVSHASKLINDENVRGVVCMCEPYELVYPRIMSPQKWQRRHVEVLHLPVMDFFDAPTVDHIIEAIEFINNVHPARVYVHCKGGIQRSATIITCYLISRRENIGSSSLEIAAAVDDAIGILRSTRKHIAITGRQREMILSYTEHLVLCVRGAGDAGAGAGGVLGPGPGVGQQPLPSSSMDSLPPPAAQVAQAASVATSSTGAAGADDDDDAASASTAPPGAAPTESQAVSRSETRPTSRRPTRGRLEPLGPVPAIEGPPSSTPAWRAPALPPIKKGS